MILTLVDIARWATGIALVIAVCYHYPWAAYFVLDVVLAVLGQ